MFTNPVSSKRTWRRVFSPAYIGWMLVIMLFVFATPALASVVLSSTTLTRLNSGSVQITWETGSEVDIAGFFVQRGAAPNASFQRISEFIPAQGGTIGSRYAFVDPEPGDAPVYQIEVVATNQQTTLEGPFTEDTHGPRASTDTVIYIPVIIK